MRFALPPLQGTISLGIYDGSGKLVRILHREDAISDFTAGNDALETEWDGNDEEGHPLPNGKYNARGYVVGDLKVEGIDYFFNDWVKDEKSPHIRRLGQLWMENGELRVDAELAGGKTTSSSAIKRSGAILREVAPTEGRTAIRSRPLQTSCTRLIARRAKTAPPGSWMLSMKPNHVRSNNCPRSTKCCAGLIMWVTIHKPERIEASTSSEKIFLVEQSRILQRLRGLALVRILSNAAKGRSPTGKACSTKKLLSIKISRS